MRPLEARPRATRMVPSKPEPGREQRGWFRASRTTLGRGWRQRAWWHGTGAGSGTRRRDGRVHQDSEIFYREDLRGHLAARDHGQQGAAVGGGTELRRRNDPFEPVAERFPGYATVGAGAGWRRRVAGGWPGVATVAEDQADGGTGDGSRLGSAHSRGSGRPRDLGAGPSAQRDDGPPGGQLQPGDSVQRGCVARAENPPGDHARRVGKRFAGGESGVIRATGFQQFAGGDPANQNYHARPALAGASGCGPAEGGAGGG